MTVGQEFKQSAQERLIQVAKTALELHTTFEGRKITSAEDTEAFQRDLEKLSADVGDIHADTIRCWAYYDQAGPDPETLADARRRAIMLEVGPKCEECSRLTRGFVDPKGKGRCRYCAAATGDASAE